MITFFFSDKVINKVIPNSRNYLSIKSPTGTADTYHNWQRAGYEQTYHNEPEYCHSATRKEIEQKGYSLVPSKYIEFRNRDEQIDFDAKMRELQGEMRDLLKQEEESTKELKELFDNLGYKI